MFRTDTRDKMQETGRNPNRNSDTTFALRIKGGRVSIYRRDRNRVQSDRPLRTQDLEVGHTTNMDLAVKDDDPTELGVWDDVPRTKAALESELYDASETPNARTQQRFSKKQGHICCFCCCDTRRAMLVVNLLQFVMTLGMSVVLVLSEELVGWVASEAQRLDDDTLQIDEEELSQVPVGRLLTLWICQMALSVCGVLGTIKFNAPLVIISILSYVVGLALAAKYSHFGIVLWNLLCIYPHVVFLQEMKQHIMTPENYPNEVHSCCCVWNNTDDSSRVHPHHRVITAISEVE